MHQRPHRALIREPLNQRAQCAACQEWERKGQRSRGKVEKGRRPRLPINEEPVYRRPFRGRQVRAAARRFLASSSSARVGRRAHLRSSRLRVSWMLVGSPLTSWRISVAIFTVPFTSWVEAACRSSPGWRQSPSAPRLPTGRRASRFFSATTPGRENPARPASSRGGVGDAGCPAPSSARCPPLASSRASAAARSASEYRGAGPSASLLLDQLAAGADHRSCPLSWCSSWRRPGTARVCRNACPG